MTIKKNRKYYIKTNIIGFIVGGLLISGVAVYAAVTFPSKDVTYDNRTSGLESTDVQGAIDEIYKTCTQTPADKIIEDNGLEKDPYECRYFFTGANPNNYVSFNGETAGWRIISIECDGTIKIIRNESIGHIVWDSSNSNNWARPASLNTYLNSTYYSSLSSAAQSQIIASDYSIGAVTNGNNDLADQVNAENSTTWNGKIALPTLSEYLRTNSNSNCKTFSTNNRYYSTCRNTTWMYTSNISYWWTLSPHPGNNSSYVFSVINNGSSYNIYYHQVNFSYTVVRPALYLNSNVKLSGSGTQSDPYVVE